MTHRSQLISHELKGPGGGSRGQFWMKDPAVLAQILVQINNLLGPAGNSDNASGPHLHFQPFQKGTSFEKSNNIPITSRNAIGQLETRGELLKGQIYTPCAESSDPAKFFRGFLNTRALLAPIQIVASTIFARTHL